MDDAPKISGSDAQEPLPAGYKFTRAEAAAIAGVEGLVMTAEMTRRFNDFDQASLPVEERIKLIRKHYSNINDEPG